MLVATAALGVDAGAMFLQKRKLQGIADAAALSAASDPVAAAAGASRAVLANGDDTAAVDRVTMGSYRADAALTPEARFVAGAASANAVRVRIVGSVPSFFGRVLSGRTRVPIVAEATAARINLAAFALGTNVVAVEGGLANAILSGLAGADLQLTAVGYEGLTSTKVDVLRVTDALRAELDMGGSSFAEVLDQNISLVQAVNALARASGNAMTADTLTRIAARVPERTIRLADAIDLGPLGSRVAADPAQPVMVDALSVLRAALALGQDGRQIHGSVGLSLPGLASTSFTLVTGARAAHSPFLTVGAAGEATLRTAQTRLYLKTTLLGGLPLGAGAITLPIYVELGAASAHLTDVSCTGGRTANKVAITVTPSVGTAAIAAIDVSRIGDFGTPLALSPGNIVSSPLVGVTAFATLPIGGGVSQVLHFDSSDIANQTHRSVSSTQMTQGLASALVARVSIGATALGTGLPVPHLAGAAGVALVPVAPALDLLIDQIGAVTGVKLGQADSWVNGVRCSTPRLIG